MESYVQFANLYDELMNDFDYEKWANYIDEIYKKYNAQPKDVLEMACGTGNLTYYLAKKKYSIVCFDLSSDMLSKAYEKLGRLRNVKILEQNMIDFKINKKFDSVISICDSINYITSNDDLLSCFQNVYNHMNENGIFIFDINSYYKLKEIIGNNIFVEDRDSVFYTWQNFYDEATDICEFYLTFFKEDQKGQYHRFDEEHIEKAYKSEEVVNMLRKVGFSVVDSYNGFSFDDVINTSERINFVAIK